VNAPDIRGESALPTLTLFVTGNAPRSRRARANLAAALESLGKGGITPMEIDLIEHPEQTVTYSIFAAPALLRTSDDGDMSVLYGDLSEADKLHRFLAELETTGT